MLRFGKYLLVEPLGKGGMAQVWMAHKPSIAGAVKVCAIKFPRDMFAEDDGQRDALLREARVAMLLNHSNIVQVNELGTVGALPYLELERIDGIDLAVLCEQMRLFGMPFSFSLAAYILQEILEALAYAHTFSIDGVAQGIIHRDISPHNVLASTAGEIKIMDFGIAAAASEHSSGKHVRGKLRYMAPEHLTARAVPQSDLFAAGAIFWELIEGQKFRHDTPYDDMRVAVIKHEVPKFSRAEVPHELARLCRGLLEFDLRTRIATAEEALKLLRLWPGGTSERAGLRALLTRHRITRRSGMTMVDVVVPPWLSIALREINREAEAGPVPPVSAVRDSEPGDASARGPSEPDAPISMRKRSSPGAGAPAAVPGAAGGFESPSARTPLLATSGDPGARLDPTQSVRFDAPRSPSSDLNASVTARTAADSVPPISPARISSTAETVTANAVGVSRKPAWPLLGVAGLGAIALGCLLGYTLVLPLWNDSRTELPNDALVVDDRPAEQAPVGAVAAPAVPPSTSRAEAHELSTSVATKALPDTAATPSASPTDAVPPAPAATSDASVVNPETTPTFSPPATDVAPVEPLTTDAPAALRARRSTPGGAKGPKARPADVSVRVRLMLLEYAELRVGAKTIVVSPSADIHVPAGTHAVQWRVSSHDPWRSGGSVAFGGGLTHVVRIGSDGPRYASSPEVDP